MALLIFWYIAVFRCKVNIHHYSPHLSIESLKIESQAFRITSVDTGMPWLIGYFDIPDNKRCLITPIVDKYGFFF